MHGDAGRCSGGAVANEYVIDLFVALAASQVRGGGIEGDESPIGRDRRRLVTIITLVVVGVYRYAGYGVCRAVAEEYVIDPVVTPPRGQVSRRRDERDKSSGVGSGCFAGGPIARRVRWPHGNESSGPGDDCAGS